MKRAALHLRVSTGEPTVENQRRDLKTAASQRDWRVIAIYNNDGISGISGRVETSRG